MPNSNMLPAHFRREAPEKTDQTPNWLNRRITPWIQSLALRACNHPLRTLTIVAALASTTYLGFLDTDLFEDGQLGNADWASLAQGSRGLETGPGTSWKWQPVVQDAPVDADVNHLALLTLVFPDSLSTDAASSAPRANTMPLPQNLSIKALPPTSNALAAITQDTTLAFSIPYEEAPEFLAGAQEIPTSSKQETSGEQKMWIMKAAKIYSNVAPSASQRVQNAWSEFVDLLKNAETLDIAIMIFGYIAMHLTFVSLFMSMRSVGSHFWLFATVLLSSVFAFVFGLLVTVKSGVPITMKLLSEGLPFLVVIIGFEKSITLTKAVLTAARLDPRRAGSDNPDQTSKPADKKSRKAGSSQNSTQHAVQIAINETGFQIVRDYVIEILVLIAGALSGVQGGLQHFCFLAAWILFFDCILLFTFYTSILSIKIEFNRIKRHVEIQRALVDDGVSRRVAEKVAEADDWAKSTSGREGRFFGIGVRSSSIPKFKALMVTGFVLVNLVNLFTFQFRAGRALTGSKVPGLSVAPFDPFKVAASGLDVILSEAQASEQPTFVTVLTPIKYELEYPSVHYASLRHHQLQSEDQYESENYGMGGKVVDSILKSLEDPSFSKWALLALGLSVILNAHLFNAARWALKDPPSPGHPIDREELNRAQTFNEPQTPATSIPGFVDPKQTIVKPPTPAATDDESELPAKLERLAAEQNTVIRSQAVMEELLAQKRVRELNDKELVHLSLQGKIPGYALEKTLQDTTRAVKIRRAVVSRTKATDTTSLLEGSLLPYEHYNYDRVLGACCENVIGYMPLPLGVAGPIVIDGQSYFLPMATTEGVLVASTSRGCKAINAGGGAVTVLTGDGMTRGPCIGFETLDRAGAAKLWVDSEVGQQTMRDAFNSTSRFARLQTLTSTLAGTHLFMRFRTTTGDAMGMNMISKGVEHALAVMANESGFDDMKIITLSGNYCTDKKAAAINWVNGRGKSVVAEAIIPPEVVKKVLKTDVESLVELNTSKNLIGSAMAGSIGGFNAHAANIVAAIFIATGQDPAQVVESSNCITIMKNLRGSLQISVSMPSIEVGTLGGGTILEPQSAMLDLLGVRGSHPTNPGDNARQLARIIAAGVMAGELSLCSALAAGHLVQSHMAHNRSAPASRATTPAPSGAQTPVTLAMTNMQERAKGLIPDRR